MVNTPDRPAQAFTFGASGLSQTSPFSSPLADTSSLGPQAAVIFKGLQKRDLTTKSRASDDLLSYLRADDFTNDDSQHDAIIKLWSSLYPNLAMEVEKRVRTNAHVITGLLVQKFQKKTVKYMSQISAIWTIGQRDNDRTVSRAAIESFELAFPLQAKRTEFHRVFRNAIEKKCFEIAFEQSASSLSDSRFTNSDDANAKFSNIASAALYVVAQLEHDEPSATDAGALLLQNTALWKGAASVDPSIQRASLTLVRSLTKVNSRVTENRTQVASGISSVLAHAHILCTLDIVQTLTIVARMDPNLIFTNSAEIKKPVPKRLVKFLSNVNKPGLSSLYWAAALDLLRLATNCKDLSDEILKPLIVAFQKSTEPVAKSQQQEAAAALSTLLARYSMAGSVFATEQLRELLRAPGPIDAYLEAFMIIGSHDSVFFNDSFQILTSSLQEVLSSTDHQALDRLHQWLSLANKLLTQHSQIMSTIVDNVHRGLALARVGEGIAYVFICSAATSIPELLRDTGLQTDYETFVNDLPRFAFSYPRETLELVKIISETSSKVSLQTLLHPSSQHEQTNLEIIELMVGQKLASPFLDDWITQDIYDCNILESSHWNLYTAHLQNSESLLIFEGLLHLSERVPELTNDVLILLQTLADKGSKLLDPVHAEQVKLFDCLWKFSRLGSTECLKGTAASLIAYNDGSLVEMFSASILRQVTTANSSSTGMSLLLDMVEPLLAGTYPVSSITASERIHGLISEVMPTSLPDTLMILHPIGVVVSELADTRADLAQQQPSYDADGFSALFRVCVFIQASHTASSGLPEHICHKLLLAQSMLELKSMDKLANGIVDSRSRVLEQAAVQRFLEKNELFIKHYAALLKSSEHVGSFLDTFICQDQKSEAEAFYNAIALYKILTYAKEQGMSHSMAESMFDLCDSLELKHGLCPMVACSAALSEILSATKKGTFKKNKLASQLTGKLTVAFARSQLVRLIALLPTEMMEEAILPRPRLMFLLRHLLEYIPHNDSDVFLNFASMTLLLRLVPEVKKEYGIFWKNLIDWILQVMESTLATPWSSSGNSLIYIGLKMISWLSSYSESNDDLSEYFINATKQIHTIIASAFIYTAEVVEDNQAKTLSSLIAARLMRSVPISVLHATQRSALPSIMSNGSEHNQLTAYTAEQSLVDQEREEMIVAAALAKEYEEVAAGLPLELISIVLDCPITGEDDIYDVPAILPSEQRAYCMGWILLFRFFNDTPLRMRVKLVQDLEGFDLVEPLLGFVFSVLRIKDDKTAEISKLSKSSLDTNFENGPEELLSYAVHIYYLCLLHIPALTRAWWIDCKDRALSSAVESFTEKHYSISLIQTYVESVQDGSSKAAINDDKLNIRVSNGGKDILTTYEIDDQQMAMAIRLPANYPLRKVTVESIQRVGVKDAQWRAWLLASQAVLTAQNGSIIDAISLFQRNITLHFEGVAECAICFSILSVQDKSLPSKKCATCKNLFHASCLFKWFKSSSQSRCPLCRNSFAF